MTSNATSAPVEPSPPAGPLALLTIPFIFTQEGLLGTKDFLKQVKERGINLSLEGLRKLHEAGLLAPLYRVDGHPLAELRIETETASGMNPRGWTVEAARDGRLRDSAQEGYSEAWPFERPTTVVDDDRHSWWNGYTYSPWQLLYLRHILREYEIIQAGWRTSADPQRTSRTRRTVCALAALSPLLLPGVLGQVSMPPGITQEGLLRLRREADVAKLLATAGFDPANLREEAESLLHDAHSSDPLVDWLPLTRHAGIRGWSKLKGLPLDCMWARIGAEILLRAHEHLAAQGHLEPLPNVADLTWHVALHDRLTPRDGDGDSLERALGKLGLSPHPRVLLLVEGLTELDHLPRLLAEFGLTKPEQVRVQQCEGSKVNAHLIARYEITPRLGKKIKKTSPAEGVQLLDRTPTALIIAMDAENKFETPAKCANERRKLQNAIREEVAFQGGEIGQADLDYLVEVRVWGDDKYELANFTDDELVPAITQLAKMQANPDVTSPTWEQDLRAELQSARAKHDDIKVPMGRLHVREDKPELAKLLWPTLIAKCEAELASNDARTPVLALVLDVRQKVAMLSSGGYVLSAP
ncbi:hypothetical protein AB0F73_16590 [Micromonospora purpureochromogenes]|uniref:hypothetical protein n=1 Tax=Micromonospora purpureochromogenes TaxID=47872 RepID=UPI0033FF6544